MYTENQQLNRPLGSPRFDLASVNLLRVWYVSNGGHNIAGWMVYFCFRWQSIIQHKNSTYSKLTKPTVFFNKYLRMSVCRDPGVGWSIRGCSYTVQMKILFPYSPSVKVGRWALPFLFQCWARLPVSRQCWALLPVPCWCCCMVILLYQYFFRITPF